MPRKIARPRLPRNLFSAFPADRLHCARLRLSPGLFPRQTATEQERNALRYTAGEDAKEYMSNRKALDDETFIGGVKAQLGLT